MTTKDKGPLKDVLAERAAIIDTVHRLTPQLTDPNTTCGRLLRTAPIKVVAPLDRHFSDLYSVHAASREFGDFTLSFFGGKHRESIQYLIRRRELNYAELAFAWNGGAINADDTGIYGNIVGQQDFLCNVNSAQLNLGSRDKGHWDYCFNLQNSNPIFLDEQQVPRTKDGFHYDAFTVDYTHNLINIAIGSNSGSSYAITLPMSISVFNREALPKVR